jgi:5'-nucleotidase (lipoprotein e(P4) family)
MMREYLLSMLVFLLFFGSCKQVKSGEENSIMGVKALLWSQYSAEAEALYLQGYNIAARVMNDSSEVSQEKPWAVVLDIDETVLDNSPFDVEKLRAGLSYSEEIWAEWCEMREAIAIPGALDFLRLAEQLGIEVFYVSNRKDNLLKATLENLNELEFPFADKAHIMLKNYTSSKDARREEISTNYNILLLIGDNLGDFDGVFDDRSLEYGKENVQKLKDEFGSRFIMLPNPMYGSWERAVFPDGMPGEKEVLETLRGY